MTDRDDPPVAQHEQEGGLLDSRVRPEVQEDAQRRSRIVSGPHGHVATVTVPVLCSWLLCTGVLCWQLSEVRRDGLLGGRGGLQPEPFTGTCVPNPSPEASILDRRGSSAPVHPSAVSPVGGSPVGSGPR